MTQAQCWEVPLFEGFCWLSWLCAVVFFAGWAWVAEGDVCSSGLLRGFVEGYSVCIYVWFEEIVSLSGVWRCCVEVLGEIEAFYWWMGRGEMMRREMIGELAVAGGTVMKRRVAALVGIDGECGLVVDAHILFDYNLLHWKAEQCFWPLA